MANENSLELKVSLRVNDSLGDLRTQLTQIESKLRNLKLKADLNISDSVNIINNKIDKLSNSTKLMRIVADLDYGKSKNNIINSMQQISKSASVDVQVKTKLDKQALNNTVKQVQQTAKSAGGIDPFDVDSFKKKMELAVRQLQLSKSHKFGGELDGFLSSVNSITKNTPNARQEMQRLNLQLKEIAINAKQVESSMATATKGILTWTVASTAFFAPIKMFQSMSQEILTVDKAMTELKRVLDATPQQYNDMLQSSIDMSKELGTNVHEVMQSLNEVARSYGDTMSQKDMLNLTKTSMVASNVSDLNAEDAMKSLIGTMNAYKISASQSLSIVDKMNEVDNNFSISTQQIAQSLEKASSVGKVYGVTLDELIGYTTSIGSVTMESGSQIGRSLKTIISRVTTLDDAKSALKSVGVSINDIQGQVKPVSQILGELSNKWNTLSDTQRQNIGVSVAGRDQLARFLALMENWGMGISATETALNSQNSAMEENAKYQDSLEARINKLKTSFTELSMSVADAMLKDSMILGLDSLTEVTNSLSGFISKAGVLAPILGTVGLAIGMLSKNARTMSTALFMGTVKMDEAKASSIGLATGLSRASVASKLLSTSFKGLLASTGVGIILAGIGFVAEKLITSMSSAKQKTEEFQQQQKEALDTYSQNKSSLSELVDQYDKLDKKLASGNFSNEDLKKHKDVAREISTLMPGLIVGEDQYGNKIIGSSERIRAKTELLDKQLQVQQKIDAIQKQEKVKDNYESSKKNLDKLQSKLDGMKSGVSTNMGTVQMDDIYKKYSKLQDKLASGKKLTMVQEDDFDFYGGLINKFESLKTEVDSAKSAYQQSLMEMIDTNVKLDSSTSTMTKSLISDFTTFVATADGASEGTINKIFGDLLDSTKNDSKFKKTLQDYSSAMTDFQNKLNSGKLNAKELKQYEKEATSSFENVKKELLSLNGVKNLDPEVLNKIMAQLKSTSDASFLASVDFDKLSKSTGLTTEQIRQQLGITGDATDSIDEMANSTSGLSDEMDKYASKLNELSSLEEQMVGTSQAKVDETNSLINTYQALGAEVSIYDAQLKNKNLTDEQSSAIQSSLNSVTANRKDIEEKLYALYPEFIQKTKDGIKVSADKIKIIKQEAEANDVLLKAYKLASSGKLNAEGIATMGSLQSTNARIKNINTEISALDKLAQAYKDNMEFYVTTLETYSKNDMFDSREAMQLQKSYMLAQQGLDRVKSMSKNKKAEYATLSKSQKNYTSSLKSTINNIDGNTSSTNKNTKSKSKNNSETTKSIYLTDKYKQYIDKLNSAMNKQEKIVSRYPTWSKAYRNALKEQIKLKQKEIDKTKEQYALLKKQIKNGTIYQTGTVNVKVKKSSVSKASNASTASLGYTGKYSSLINKYAKQYGVNPNLIAAIIKQESGFNTKAISPAGARGLMQLMPATARSLGVKNSYDPSQNIKGGTKYIAQMLKKYGGNIEKALRAYNAGPGNLAKSYGFAETNKYVKNVTSNFNSYLKKAGGNITKVSTSAIKNMEATVKKTTTRKLAGWSGQITQGYGGKNGHLGVDIDGKKGQRLESNVNGKVKFAGKGTGVNKSYGNYVVVTGSNGKSYLYAHLDATSVKKGQTVKVGQKIGEIGNTGNVVKGKGGDGSHLHYEVRDKNGNRINPLSSVKYAKQNRTVTTSKTVSTKGVVTKSKQALDDAKQTLKDLYDLVVNDNADIAEYRQAIIDSYLESYDRKVDFHEKKKSNRAISKERSVGDSDWYRKAVENDITNTKYEIKYTKQKQAYIKKLMKSKSITPAEKAKLGDQLDEIKQQLNQYTSDLIASRSEYIGSRISEYDYDIELKDRNITKQENLQGLMNSTSKQYTKSLASEKKSAKEKAKLLRSELNYAVVQSKYLKNGYAEMRKQKQKADEIKNAIIENDQKLAEIANKEYDVKLAKNNDKISDYDYLLNRSEVYADSLFDDDPAKYKEFGNQISLKQKKLKELVDNNDVLYDALKDPKLTAELKKQRKQELEENKMMIVNLEAEVRNMYKDTADYMIDLYKEVYEKRRDLEIKAIDDERTRYQKLINDKIDALQKANEEEDHQNEVNDYQKRISDLEKRIKQFTGDDSRVGIYEKKKAEDDLVDLKKEYEKFMRDYETQNKIDAWQNDLTDKENELDDTTEATNKYFDNLVNDEREFNKLRQQLIDGNVKGFKESLSGMDEFITSNMDGIGISIAQNISDQIKNVAIPKLDELAEHYDNERNNNVTSTPDNAPPIHDNYNSTSTNPTSDKITTVKSTKLYKSKSTKSTVLIKIPKGTTLTYSDYASEWYKVTYKDKTGYIYRPDLQITKTTTSTNKNTGAVTKTTSVTDAKGFVSKTSTTTAKGSKLLNTVRKYDEKGNVTSTNYGNVMTTGDVTYRSKPDKDVKPVGTFKKGTKMEIEAVGDYYAKVLYNSKTYYLDKSKLKAFKTGGFTGDNVPESGALALLHKKELVLNEKQTAHILEASKMFKQNTTISNTFAKFKPQSNIVTNEGNKTNQIDKLINIEQFNGTEMDYKKMQNEMLKVMRKYGFSR